MDMDRFLSRIFCYNRLFYNLWVILMKNIWDFSDKRSFSVDQFYVWQVRTGARAVKPTRYSMSDAIKIFWCWTFTQHTSFYLTSYVPDMNYIIQSLVNAFSLSTDPLISY